MFVGRSRELELLQQFYDDDTSRVACLTGQRGMGKSALLEEFAKDKKHIYYTAYPTADTGQMILFARAVSKACDLSGFDNELSLDGQRTHNKTAPTLTDLLDRLAQADGDDKLLIIIDEYYNFAKADASYEKLMHDFITECDASRFKLILCGDSFLSMDKYVLGKKAIYKDTDVLSIRLGQLNFLESRAFFEGSNGEECTFLYGITGGIPGNLVRLPDDIGQAVRRVFLDGGASLLPETTMSIDLRELSYYNRMLTILAQGYNRVNQISAVADKPKDVVVPYMNTLMSIGVVEKHTAITEKNNRKKTRYGIDNTNYLFWYRYIAPNIDRLYDGTLADMIDDMPPGDMRDYLRTVFVRMCGEYLLRQADGGRTPFSIDDIGNWWENDEDKGTSVGFDLVALGSCGDKPCSVFARCYYNETPIEMATLKGLIEMTKRVKSSGDVFYVVFSRSGFHENTLTVAGAIKNIMLITLDEVVSD